MHSLARGRATEKKESRTRRSEKRDRASKNAAPSMPRLFGNWAVAGQRRFGIDGWPLRVATLAARQGGLGWQGGVRAR